MNYDQHHLFSAEAYHLSALAGLMYYPVTLNRFAGRAEMNTRLQSIAGALSA